MIVVSDTSPLSNLATIGQLELLRKLYSTIVIPLAVYQELLNASDPAVQRIRSLEWIYPRSVTNVAFLQTLQANLDAGEAEAIALAVELNADRLLVDERRGRQLAVAAGLKVTGLLGVLLTAKQQRLISKVQPLLDELIAQGFWLQNELYQEVLRLAEEL